MAKNVIHSKTISQLSEMKIIKDFNNRLKLLRHEATLVEKFGILRPLLFVVGNIFTYKNTQGKETQRIRQ